MKFVKGLTLGLLIFLLSLSLFIFGLALTLNYTILNPDFAVFELDRLDIPSLTKELLSQQIPQDEPYIAEVTNNTIADLEPWIREQMRAGIYSGYDYMLGKSQSLSLVIPLEPMRDSLKSNLREAILQSPPLELAGAPQAAIELYINEAYQYIDELIPPRFEFTESLLSPAVLLQLEQVRQDIGYFQTGFGILIGFILLLILGIILINRQVRSATRKLGIIFLTYGVLEYIGILVAKSLGEGQLSQLDIPPPLQTWLPQFFDNLLAPLEIFSIGLLSAGIALIIVSFVYKPRQPSL